MRLIQVEEFAPDMRHIWITRYGALSRGRFYPEHSTDGAPSECSTARACRPHSR